MRCSREPGRAAAQAEECGGAITQRRGSASADVNAGVYDSLTNQSFTYRAAVDPAQASPPAGNYTDRIRVDVEF